MGYYCNIVAFMNIDFLYNTIRENGGRLTKVRRAIIDALVRSDCLMSQADLQSALIKSSIHPNRSTLFRELIFLVKHAIIIKNSISGKDYYEIPHDHHHHLVCLGCRSIKKVHLTNHLVRQEKQIGIQNKFTITNHSLDFYGFCKNCT